MILEDGSKLAPLGKETGRKEIMVPLEGSTG